MTRTTTPRLSSSILAHQYVPAKPRRVEMFEKGPAVGCAEKKKGAKVAPLFFQDLQYLYAAAVRTLFPSGASSPSHRTLTIFETPGSCIVTP